MTDLPAHAHQPLRAKVDAAEGPLGVRPAPVCVEVLRPHTGIRSLTRKETEAGAE